MAGEKDFAVAASSEWTDDEDGVRLPAGEAHAWVPGQNQTVCGLPLRRAQLTRFPHVTWADALPESGGGADRVKRLCPRCRSAAAGRTAGRDSWRRVNPRP
ncbi:hypothetical protein [Streptomyces sp. WMMB 322]|uniref:hypothetical protein n=1 Tax=Streptomyces sp. WMMB 322 TaxID=1286821 RepID=UPI0006E2DBDC|nr:hypothetical protein [Streptomyces sp. WMMB 322]SCK12902.1 hypothetical protein H180DRAFT_00769 [Streptomyces sp. WMMB 322]